LGSYEDVRRSLEHKRDLGATVVKEFMTARRDRRRWLGEAARELGLGIASHIEGLPRALSLVADGYTGFEHGVELRPLRDDVRQYLARTGAIWTPTRYSSPLHNAYWQEIVRRWPEQEQKYSVYDFRKSGMRRYPPDTPANSYEYQERELAVWLASGVKLSTSSHGDDSIKVHRELWILQQVGAPPNVLLRAGTMIAAEKMGLEKELGSLEVGKIADILVLKANPLDDVMNTMAIKYVMADGILYDPMTVAESTERNNQ
jgi:imidazolonepropionase-like amidohydrolase